MVSNRRGVGLLEITVSSILVGVMLILSMQVIGWTKRANRDIDHRAMALQVVANLLDDLASLPWNELTAERLHASTLSSEDAALLSPAVLEVSLKEFDDDPTAKQITVTLRWPEAAALKQAPVRLTAWVYGSRGN